MDSGQLHHRIVIQQITGYTAQPSGEQDPVWGTYANVWAKISPVSGKELELAQIKSIGPTTTHHITIRWYPAIDPKTMQIGFTDRANSMRIFSIDNVLNLDEDGVWLTLECTEFKK